MLAPPAPPARAGDVTSSFAGDKLVLKGSPEDDELTLVKAESGPQDVVVTPGDGTTLNGGTDPQTFLGVGELLLLLKGGDNEVTGTDLFLPRKLNWQGGDGKDVLVLTGCTIGDDLIAALRQGDDRVQLNDCTILSTLRYLGSSGNDSLSAFSCDIGELDAALSAGTNTFALNSSTFGRIDATSGPDAAPFALTMFTLQSSEVQGDVLVSFGSLNGSFTLSSLEVGGRVRLKSGSRDDNLTASNVTVGEDLRLQFGSGQNNASLGNCSVADELRYDGGSQRDLLSLNGGSLGSLDVRLKGKEQGQLNLSNDVTVAGVLEVQGGTASNVLNLSVAVGGSAKLKTGPGSDVVTFYAATFQSHLDVWTASGPDVINLGTSTIQGNLRVFAGPDDDTVNDQLVTVVGTKLVDLGPDEP